MVTGKTAVKLSYVLVLASFRDEVLAEQHAESLRKRSEASVGLNPACTVLKALKSHESYVEYCIQKSTTAERKRYC